MPRERPKKEQQQQQQKRQKKKKKCSLSKKWIIDSVRYLADYQDNSITKPWEELKQEIQWKDYFAIFHFCYSIVICFILLLLFINYIIYYYSFSEDTSLGSHGWKVKSRKHLVLHLIQTAYTTSASWRRLYCANYTILTNLLLSQGPTLLEKNYNLLLNVESNFNQLVVHILSFSSQVMDSSSCEKCRIPEIKARKLCKILWSSLSTEKRWAIKSWKDMEES